MVQTTCMVQAEQIDAAQRATLNAGLQKIARDHFEGDLKPEWIEVPVRSGYMAGKLSTTSIVHVVAEGRLEQSGRAQILQEVCDLWTATTSCTYDEIVAVVADPPATTNA